MTVKKRVTTGFFSGCAFSFSPVAPSVGVDSFSVARVPSPCLGTVREAEERPVEVRGVLAPRDEVTRRESPWAFALAQVRIRSMEENSQYQGIEYMFPVRPKDRAHCSCRPSNWQC